LLTLKTERGPLEQEPAFVATHIAFGQHHAAVVANDASTNSPLKQMPYAVHILKELRRYLSGNGQDEAAIQKALRTLFIKQAHTFPHVTVESLKEAMVFKAGMAFDDTVTYNRFFSDIQDAERRVNLK